MHKPSGVGEGRGLCSTVPRQSVRQQVRSLHVEEYGNHIAVLDGVGLPLNSQQSVPAAFRDTASGDQVVEADDLRPDESTIQIAVNLPGGLLCRRIAPDCPGPDLVFTYRKE